MVVKNSLQNLALRALNESLGVDMMTRIALIVFGDYDLYGRAGYPVTVPVPPQTAAKQVVSDVVREGKFLQFVEALIKIEREGYYGRKYPIACLRELIKAVMNEGYFFDQDSNLFVENRQVTCTPNWSRINEGEEATFAFLRIDIVQNSAIVRANMRKTVEKAYDRLRETVKHACEKRNGRLWLWEGDGGLASFYFGGKNAHATLAGMEILHEVFWYNTVNHELQTPLSVRLAAHAGLARFYSEEAELKKNETIREIIEVEGKFTPPDTLAVTPNVFLSLDRVIGERFTLQKSAGDWKLATYRVGMEKP